MRTVFLIFRLICYAAFVVVTLGMVGMLVFGHSGICPSFSTGSIRCDSAIAQQLAELTMGILLVSAFTGLPVLLALLGLFFAIRAAVPALERAYRKIRPRPEGSEARREQQGARQQLARMGKIIAYLMVAIIVCGVIAGIYDASTR